MKNLRKIAFIFVVSTIILSVFNLSNAETGIVDTTAVRIREKASTDSEILTKGYEGEKVEIIGEEGEWYKLKINGKTGYARKDLIKKETSQSTEQNENVSTYETPEKEDAKNIVKEDILLKLLPNFGSNDIKLVTKGEKVELKKELNNWIEISINDVSGWILKNKLGTEEEVTVEEPEEETKPEDPVNTETTTESEEPKDTKQPETNQVSEVRNSKGKVNVETANVRAKADIKSSIINHLDEGDEVTIVEEVGDWYKIKSQEILEGYVSKTLITIVDVTSRNTQESREEVAINNITVKGSEVVEFAKKYLGTSYVLGGKTPETGFDCSGFTRYIFKNFGYSLGTVAASQDTVGSEVSRENLKEGDLILFYDEAKTKIGHTGIYIGGDQFIHAANPERGVVIDGFSTNSYYSTRFVTARRIVE